LHPLSQLNTTAQKCNRWRAPFVQHNVVDEAHCCRGCPKVPPCCGLPDVGVDARCNGPPVSHCTSTQALSDVCCTLLFATHSQHFAICIHHCHTFRAGAQFFRVFVPCPTSALSLWYNRHCRFFQLTCAHLAFYRVDHRLLAQLVVLLPCERSVICCGCKSPQTWAVHDTLELLTLRLSLSDLHPVTRHIDTHVQAVQAVAVNRTLCPSSFVHVFV
jgi:hypothetical protein